MSPRSQSATAGSCSSSGFDLIEETSSKLGTPAIYAAPVRLMEPGKLLLLSVILAAVVTDVRSRRIPNALIVCGMVLGVASGTWADGIAGTTMSVLGFAIAIAIFVPFFAMRWVGAGDVKLLGVVGAFAGPSGALWISLYSALAGGIIGVAMLCIRERQFPTFAFVFAKLFAALSPPARGAKGRHVEGSNPAPAPYSANTGKIPYATAILAGTLAWMLTPQ